MWKKKVLCMPQGIFRACSHTVAKRIASGEEMMRVHVCLTPKLSFKPTTLAIIRHLSTPTFALQQCLVAPLRVAFLPSQHNTFHYRGRL